MTTAILVDAVIAVLVVEMVAYAVWSRRPSQAPRPSVATLAPTWASGLSLALALRAVLADAGIVPLAALLGAAGIAHVLDLRSRFRR